MKTLLDYLEAGDSLDEFLDHFPKVKREQAIAALEAPPSELSNILIKTEERKGNCPRLAATS